MQSKSCMLSFGHENELLLPEQVGVLDRIKAPYRGLHPETRICDDNALQGRKNFANAEDLEMRRLSGN